MKNSFKTTTGGTDMSMDATGRAKKGPSVSGLCSPQVMLQSNELFYTSALQCATLATFL